MIEARLESVTISDGTKVPLTPNGVTVFVGPNNAGKSQALRDIDSYCAGNQAYQGRCVVDMAIHKSGTPEEFSEWFEQNAPRRVVNLVENFVVENFGAMQLSDAIHWWSQPGFNHLKSMFVFHANALGRLTGADAPESVDFSNKSPTHPIQKAYLNGELERLFGELSRSAFGLETVVDRYGGSHIPLRVARTRPNFAHENGVPDRVYLDELHHMPRLQDQGDGVKSFMGLLIHVLAGNHPLTLVDEPEAFLHPPQAKMLGELLAARSAEASRQVIVATHSVDVLQGILNAGAPATIIRLTREDDVNHAAVLQNDDLKELWSDPLLKHSNVLDGLFHDAVAVCEADSDCRLYSATLESVLIEDEAAAVKEEDGQDAEVQVTKRSPQILFTHCGGKARLPVVVKALRAVSVPTIVVADLDLLRDAEDVKRVLEAGGNDFTAVQSDLKVLDAALKSDEKPLGRIALREALVKAIDDGPDTLDRKSLNALKGLLRLDSGWDKVKKGGVGSVPQGDAYQACTNILAALKTHNVLVVPVGYLERFAPQVPGHGPAWVAEVLAQGLHDDKSLTELRSFVRDILHTSREPA